MSDEPLLTVTEARVLGALIEKSYTTPENYPLSLHSLTTACNQKSSRKPVMQLFDHDVDLDLDELRLKKLVLSVSTSGGRVLKFRHNVEELGELNDSEIAVLCELLLRGPQTPGELRTHANRISPLPDIQNVYEVLTSLSEWQDGAFVVMLPREPGRRESRYMHLLSGPPSEELMAPTAVTASVSHTSSGPSLRQQVADMQEEITSLKSEMKELREQVDTFRNQFE